MSAQTISSGDGNIRYHKALYNNMTCDIGAKKGLEHRAFWYIDVLHRHHKQNDEGIGWTSPIIDGGQGRVSTREEILDVDRWIYSWIFVQFPYHVDQPIGVRRIRTAYNLLILLQAELREIISWYSLESHVSGAPITAKRHAYMSRRKGAQKRKISLFASAKEGDLAWNNSTAFILSSGSNIQIRALFLTSDIFPPLSS